ncbi:MFS family permease [Modestobacter versicolor]|uniref:MFS family permease n=1 Tax=Modestobacter versicolor TaxID=429133 RepID=A0A839Y8Q8_9ACTN|nr:MFS family permease [Modestobacter versicolor]
MPDSPAPRARRRRRSGGAPDPGPETTPLGVRRQQTRPLPVAGRLADATPTDPGHPAPPPGPAATGPSAPGLGATGPSPSGLGARPPRVTVTRVAASRTRELSGAAVRRVRAYGRADGAADSGLTGLFWVNALHMAGDAMIAVSLAGTLFFAAASDAQRGNVALYLLVTMAPFALVAPVIGPALDRLQRGRRWALAGSLAGRAALAVLMAAHHDDLALYPAALGVLVLSKAFNVLRAAVVPRVLPPALSLTSANARMSVFGLAAGGVLGALGAGIAALLGFGWELGATAAVFAVAAVLAVRLPGHVDVPGEEEPADVLRTAPLTVPGRRNATTPHVVTALRATAALRGLSGFLTIFSAFLVQATVDGGWEATVALGGIAAAAGAGSFLGTGIGARLHTTSPDRVVLAAAGTAAAITVVAAFWFSLWTTALVAGVAAVANALGKAALDAIIQREVPDSLRASAFARSETWLQLAWVLGGALAIALPTTGWLGFTVAAALLVLAVGLTLWSLRSRRGTRTVDREART